MADKYPGWSPYNYCLQNPVILVDSDGNEPTPAEAARMSAHIYGGYGDNYLIGGWQVSSRYVGLSASDYNNESTGLQSALYEREKADGTIEYCYVTAGTNPKEWQDLTADALQESGLSRQYDKSLKNARILNENLKNKELSFAGHSLGGGTASANAIATSRRALTFNAAGLSAITKWKAGGFMAMFTNYSDIITAYKMNNDPLTILQEAPMGIPLPDAEGKGVYLKPGKGGKGGHSIDNMVNAIENPVFTYTKGFFERISDSYKDVLGSIITTFPTN